MACTFSNTKYNVLNKLTDARYCFEFMLSNYFIRTPTTSVKITVNLLQFSESLKLQLQFCS